MKFSATTIIHALKSNSAKNQKEFAILIKLECVKTFLKCVLKIMLQSAVVMDKIIPTNVSLMLLDLQSNTMDSVNQALAEPMQIVQMINFAKPAVATILDHVLEDLISVQQNTHQYVDVMETFTITHATLQLLAYLFPPITLFAKMIHAIQTTIAHQTILFANTFQLLANHLEFALKDLNSVFKVFNQFVDAMVKRIVMLVTPLLLLQMLHPMENVRVKKLENICR